jgi:hypothetical protein
MLNLNKNKKAQFYIIAALIIIAILISLAGTANYLIVKQEPTEFYDLGENLEIEGASIIDYGIYSNEDVNQKILDFSRNFSKYLIQTQENFELIIISGTSSAIIAKQYTPTSSGTVYTGLGRIHNYQLNETIIPINSGTTSLNISGTTYDINIQEDENFFFVLTTNTEFEKFVYGNLE